jgi:hypothetical protein
MSDDEDIAALVIDNVSGMMKGEFGFTEWRERGTSCSICSVVNVHFAHVPVNFTESPLSPCLRFP